MVFFKRTNPQNKIPAVNQEVLVAYGRKDRPHFARKYEVIITEIDTDNQWVVISGDFSQPNGHATALGEGMDLESGKAFTPDIDDHNKKGTYTYKIPISYIWDIKLKRR